MMAGMLSILLFLVVLLFTAEMNLADSENLGDPSDSRVVVDVISKARMDIIRDEIETLHEQARELQESPGPDTKDELKNLESSVREKLSEFQKIKKAGLVPEGQEPGGFHIEEIRHKLEEYPEEIRKKIESQIMKSKLEQFPDGKRESIMKKIKESRGSGKSAPKTHEERVEMEKEQNKKHLAFIAKRKDDYLIRIEKAGFTPEEANFLTKEVDELSAEEAALVESRMQISLDFHDARQFTDAKERQEFLGAAKKRREENRAKDEKSREHIRVLRDHIDLRLRQKERAELRK